MAAVATRRFSWLGLGCVAVIAGSALPQSLSLIGDVGGLFGTAYGLTALAKTAGLAGLLAMAALNRFILTPRIGHEAGRRALVLSIAVETALGAAVVAAAVGLASLPPGAHEQAVWPFALQPDLSRIGEAYYAKELWRGAAILVVALGMVVSLLWRRTRLFGPIIGAALLFWLPLPNFALLAKPAWPTSFQRSETGFAAAAILRGEALTKELCTADCFRPRDDPSDPSPYGLWQRGDGDLYGWLTDVFDRIGHSPFPYGTIAKLDPRERWQLIDYFRARVAGSVARNAGNWPYPVLTPDFPVTCRDGRSSMRDILGQSGRPIEIAIPGRDGAAPPPAPQDIVLTRILLASAQDDAVPTGVDCVSTSPDAPAALALIAGVDQRGLAGGRLLADANGWLRSRLLPLPSDDEKRTLTAWAAEISRVAAAPFEAGGIGTHRH
ncbi:CopD family protein [Bosea sp. RCC_152_1]|uniref:CopD family protein n=1 Tax=Bosea sp. RCC_152_1 TaxID=3239228 RepID=UPI003523A050